MTEDFSFFKNRVPAVMGEAVIHHSAVAIVLLDTPSGSDILFEVRSEKIGHQPGDVCCPGGMTEEGETPEQAVIREMTEELLVDVSQIEILGPSDIFRGGSMQVHPFVCRLSGYDGRSSTDEVEEVFRVPLSFFLETEPKAYEVTWHAEPGEDFPYEKIHGGRSYPWRKRKDRILFYEYGGHVIWGMTAKIMERFAELCRAEQACSPDISRSEKTGREMSGG